MHIKGAVSEGTSEENFDNDNSMIMQHCLSPGRIEILGHGMSGYGVVQNNKSSNI